jgi:cytochrome c-type biogenesis protein CcmF
VLGWGGYWGWDPVENGSLVPWLANTALLHGLLVQRVTGSLRRTNFLLAITAYVLVLYASFLTRSGVLADFSVHSFVNLGLNGFLLSFLFLTMIVGYGAVLVRWRDIPKPAEPLGSFSRESMMWLGQLVFMLMCALIAVGMSAPLITRLIGVIAPLFGRQFPISNVQTEYYNLVNAPLAIALGLLLGMAPLMRWRSQEPRALVRAALPAVVAATLISLVAVVAGVRTPVPALIIFGAAFALSANLVVMLRGFRAGWKHGVAYMGHLGVSILLIGVIASSGYGNAIQVQLPRGEARSALGYEMTFGGVTQDRNGHERMLIAVAGAKGHFKALPAMYWSEFNQGYMKKPHIERYLTHDVYISPLEMVGADPADRAIWFSKGESRQIGQVTYTFVDFDVQGMGSGEPRVAAVMRAEIGGRTVPVRPVIEMKGGVPNRMPDYLPGGGSVQILGVDPENGRVGLELPGMERPEAGNVLAVEISTKPLINFVWLGAVVMLLSGFLSMARRFLDLRRGAARPTS